MYVCVYIYSDVTTLFAPRPSPSEIIVCIRFYVGYFLLIRVEGCEERFRE